MLKVLRASHSQSFSRPSLNGFCSFLGNFRVDSLKDNARAMNSGIRAKMVATFSSPILPLSAIYRKEELHHNERAAILA